VDPVLAFLTVVAAGLALVLGALAFAAAQRFSESRFVYAGLALVALGGVSALGLVDLLFQSAVPGASLGYPSTVLLLVAEVLLYVSMVTRRGRSGRRTDA
jgi:hypothetical protein